MLYTSTCANWPETVLYALPHGTHEACTTSTSAGSQQPPPGCSEPQQQLRNLILHNNCNLRYMTATVLAHWWNLAQVQAELHNGENSGDWGWDAFFLDVSHLHSILEWFPSIKHLQSLWFQRHPRGEQQDAAEFYDWLRTLLPTMHQTGTWRITLKSSSKTTFAQGMIPLPPPPNLCCDHFPLQQAIDAWHASDLALEQPSDWITIYVRDTVQDNSHLQVRLDVDPASLSVWMPSLSRDATPVGTDVLWHRYQCSAILLRSGRTQHSGHYQAIVLSEKHYGPIWVVTDDGRPATPSTRAEIPNTCPMHFGFGVSDKWDAHSVRTRWLSHQLTTHAACPDTATTHPAWTDVVTAFAKHVEHIGEQDTRTRSQPR